MRREILKLLEANANTSPETIAEKTGLAVDEIVSEIENMKSEGIICGSSAIINWDKADKTTVTALIEVKVTPQRNMGFEKIAERIYQYSEVNSVYLMSGAYDFTVIVEGKTMRQIAQFVSEKLSTMNSVLSTATHFILKKYKDHGTVMCERPEDERMMITP